MKTGLESGFCVVKIRHIYPQRRWTESWNGLDLRVARCVQAGSVERPAERLMRLCGCEEDVYGALKPC